MRQRYTTSQGKRDRTYVRPMKTSPEELAKFDSLLRCLYRYVEANPDRFRILEERVDGKVIHTIILAEDASSK